MAAKSIIVDEFRLHLERLRGGGSLSSAYPCEGAHVDLLLTLSPEVQHPRNFERFCSRRVESRGINQVEQAQNSEIQFRYGENSFVIVCTTRPMLIAPRIFAREKSTANRFC